MSIEFLEQWGPILGIGAGAIIGGVWTYRILESEKRAKDRSAGVTVLPPEQAGRAEMVTPVRLGRQALISLLGMIVGTSVLLVGLMVGVELDSEAGLGLLTFWALATILWSVTSAVVFRMRVQRGLCPDCSKIAQYYKKDIGRYVRCKSCGCTWQAGASKI